MINLNNKVSENDKMRVNDIRNHPKYIDGFEEEVREPSIKPNNIKDAYDWYVMFNGRL